MEDEMKFVVLIILMSGFNGSGGVAIHDIDGFRDMKQCQIAADEIKRDSHVTSATCVEK